MRVVILHTSEKIACVSSREAGLAPGVSDHRPKPHLTLCDTVWMGAIGLLHPRLQSWYQEEDFFPLKHDVTWLFQLCVEKGITSWEWVQTHKAEVFTQHATRIFSTAMVIIPAKTVAFAEMQHFKFFFTPSFEVGRKVTLEYMLRG